MIDYDYFISHCGGSVLALRLLQPPSSAPWWWFPTWAKAPWQDSLREGIRGFWWWQKGRCCAPLKRWVLRSVEMRLDTLTLFLSAPRSARSKWGTRQRWEMTSMGIPGVNQAWLTCLLRQAYRLLLCLGVQGEQCLLSDMTKKAFGLADQSIAVLGVGCYGVDEWANGLVGWCLGCWARRRAWIACCTTTWRSVASGVPWGFIQRPVLLHVLANLVTEGAFIKFIGNTGLRFIVNMLTGRALNGISMWMRGAHIKGDIWLAWHGDQTHALFYSRTCWDEFHRGNKRFSRNSEMIFKITSDGKPLWSWVLHCW